MALVHESVKSRDEDGVPIVALDIAGEENGYPNDNFADAYKLARRHLLQATVHAGTRVHRSFIQYRQSTDSQLGCTRRAARTFYTCTHAARARVDRATVDHLCLHAYACRPYFMCMRACVIQEG